MVGGVRCRAVRHGRFLAVPNDGVDVLGVAQHVGHAADAATLDADLLHQAVDHRGLHPVAERTVDDLVGHVLAAAAAAVESVDVKDVDPVDLLHRLHAFAHDPLDLVEQLQAGPRSAGLDREDVVGLVGGARSLCVDLEPFGLGAVADHHGVGVGLRGGALRVGEAQRRVAFGFGLGGQSQSLALRVAAGRDHVDGPSALGDLPLANREGLLLGQHGGLTGLFGIGDRDGAGFHPTRDFDGLLDLGDFERSFLLDLELAQVAVADHPGLAEPAFGGDAGPLDLLARRDLGFLEGLPLGDLQALQRALALDPRLVDLALAHHPLALDLGPLQDLGAPRLDLGLDDLHGLARQRDVALPLGQNDRSPTQHLQRLLLLALTDAVELEPELGRDLGPFDVLIGFDAGPFDVEARCDLGRLEDLALFDLQRFELAFTGDTGLVEASVAGDTSLLDDFLGGDLGLAPLAFLLDHLDRFPGHHDLALALGHLDGLPPADLELLLGPQTIDPLAFDRETSRDLVAFGRLAAFELRGLDGPASRDLALLDLFVLGGADLGQAAFLGDFRPLGCLVGLDLGLLSLVFAQGAFPHQGRALHGPAHLHLALLLEAGIFAVPVDLQRPPLRIEVLVADRQHRVLLDLVAHLAARLDDLRELGETLGVEGVRGVEMFEPGLVEIDERDGFELESVEGQSLAGEIAHLCHEEAALLVDVLKRHFGRDGAERRGELAFEKVPDAVGHHGAPAEGLGRERDRHMRRRNPQEELGNEVDAHAVACDQRIGLAAPHFDAHHVHVDGRHLVQHRHHEGSSVDDDALAAESGPDEGGLFRRAPVEPAQQVDRDHHQDRRDDQPKDHCPQDLRTHLRVPLAPTGRRFRVQCLVMALNRLVCSVTARSVGRRSIEEAP